MLPACPPQTGPITIHCTAKLSTQCKDTIHQPRENISRWVHHMLKWCSEHHRETKSTGDRSTGETLSSLNDACSSKSQEWVSLCVIGYSTSSWITTSEVLRYSTCSQGISQFYLHTHTFIHNRNEPYLPLPSQLQLVLIITDHGGMEGWVDCGAK